MRTKLVIVLGFVLMFLYSCVINNEEIGPQGAPGNANVRTELFINRPFVLDSVTGEYIILMNVQALDSEIIRRGFIDASIRLSVSPSEKWNKLPTIFVADTLSIVPTQMHLRYKENVAEIYAQSNPGALGLDIRLTLISGPFTP